jgi:predicted ATPase
MRLILPGLVRVDAERVQSYRYLRFIQSETPVGLYANSMSEGTLRALAIPIALFQRIYGSYGSATPSLVAIEVPETGIHPAAAGILLDSLAGQEGPAFGCNPFRRNVERRDSIR